MTGSSKNFATSGHPPVLIEDWLPIRELSIESVRESAPIPGQFPKIKTLHVWWARAPLAAANGVVLTSLLPVWDDALLERIVGLEAALLRVRAARRDLQRHAEQMDRSEWYRVWVLWLCGIWGDTIAAKEASTAAKARGQPLKHNPFTWRPAFKNCTSIADLNVLHRLLIDRWGELPAVLDPTAGGGSIPYTAMRFGLPTWANDLNQVAVSILDATLRASSICGLDLIEDLNKWGRLLVDRCVGRLKPYFPVGKDGCQVTNYLFANTVACPRSGGPVPLSPNWWLDKSGKGIGVRLVPVRSDDDQPSHIQFEIDCADAIDFDEGTVARGDGISPWDGLVIDGDYIKAEAQAGRMWPTLYAVVCKRAEGRRIQRYFRSPEAVDISALEAAKDALDRLAPVWEAEEILPSENINDGSKTAEAIRYGITQWVHMFTARQLLVHGTFVEEWRRLLPQVLSALGHDRGGEVMTLLALMQGKATNFNSRLASWHVARQTLRSVFERHDFAFKWTYAEFEGAQELFPWCFSQILDSYSGIADLLKPDTSLEQLENETLENAVPGSIIVSAGSAARLLHVENKSIACVNIDPPYYDNVQYAELSDFFYVWEKRTLGILHPERFADHLSNKDDEAVANVARFADAGRRKSELANFDYQQKMQAIFLECHRVLRDDGVMVVWFTHKRAEAWDTLATAMMEAGFTIEASWPVTTQSETSLHHAKKNSAKSTIMLVCRKQRQRTVDESFFEDIELELRHAARNAVVKFEQEVGVGGVDLQLATYGPTLSVISRNWPVLSSEPDESGRSRRLRPEEALAVARQEVARLRMARLVGKDANFDPATDFWLLCWETFQAREFPYDEARKLALGVGYDVEDAVRMGLVKKKSGNVELITPVARGRALRRTIDDAGRFAHLVDALQFLLMSYRDDKLASARTWLTDSGYGEEQRFTDVMQAAVNAVPRVRTKKGLSVEEATLIEDVVVALFGDEIKLPVESQERVDPQQFSLV
jgi:putative DNA methylase